MRRHGGGRSAPNSILIAVPDIEAAAGRLRELMIVALRVLNRLGISPLYW